jgi:hypothetical protein
VYKHARARHRVSDEANAQDEDAFRQKQMDSAGIGEEPTLFSILTAPRIAATVVKYRKEGVYDYAKLAHKLNGAGLRDANDAYWTPSSLKTFMEHASLFLYRNSN